MNEPVVVVQYIENCDFQLDRTDHNAIRVHWDSLIWK